MEQPAKIEVVTKIQKRRRNRPQRQRPQPSLQRTITTVRSAPTQKKNLKNFVKRQVRKEERKKMKLSRNPVASTPGMARQSAIDRAVATIVLPESMTECRWSSEFSTNPTAVAHPWTLFADSTATNAQTSKPLPPSEGMAFAFRDPLRAYVVYDANTSGTTYEYAAVFWASSFSTGPTAGYTIPGIEDTNQALPISYYTCATPNYQPHGAYLYCGGDEQTDLRYVWMQAGTIVNFTTTTYSANGKIFFHKWQDGKTSIVTALTTTIANGSFASPAIVDSGYYALSATNPAGPNVLSELYFSHNDAVFCHQPLPYFSNNALSTEGIRIMGVSMKLTNKAAELYKQGQVVGAQLPEREDWSEYVSGGFSAISILETSTTLPAKNGIFGFLKPTKPEDFSMMEYYQVHEQSIVDCCYPLQSRTGFLVIAYKVAPEEGRDFYWTINYSIEYGTTDVWRQRDVSYLPPDLSNAALGQIKFLTQFHENPLHWKELWQKIKNVTSQVANGVIKYGPAVIGGAKTIAGLLL